LHASLERVPGAVFTIDLRGRIVDLNSHLSPLFRAEFSAIVRSNLSAFVSADSVATLLELQAECLEKGEAGPARLLLASGATVAACMARIDDADRRPVGFQCFAQNWIDPDSANP
jgi:PAS domain-containing protein